MYFANDFFAKTHESDPTIKMTDISKLAGKKWSEMTEAEKSKFEKLNAADKARNEKQQACLEKNGYFFLEDGSKSTDEKNVPKQKHSLSKANQSFTSEPEETKAVRKPIKKAAAPK